MRIYDGDADREVGGHESRVQMAKAPRAVGDAGGWGNGEDRAVIKGDRCDIVGRSDHKSPLLAMQNCES